MAFVSSSLPLMREELHHRSISITSVTAYSLQSIPNYFLLVVIMVRISSACALALVVSSASAFVPASSPTSFSSTTELGLSRRDAMNSVGLAIGGILVGMPEPSVAANNPALQTFKGGRKTKGKLLSLGSYLRLSKGFCF